jgi:uncharacterized repeat protein (TIGR01451 family)
MHHCPSDCHAHQITTMTGTSGSFTAPDHDYPAHLELQLTATDSGGLTDTKSVTLQPNTVDLTFASNPTGLQLVVGGSSSMTPFARTVIVNSNNSISATTPQTLNGVSYGFSSWSDGGAQTHNITAPASPRTYTATYKKRVDLAITKTGSVTSGRATFTLAVRNGGPETADDVVVTDVLADRLTFVSASATAGLCTYDSGARSVRCSLGSLSAGASATVTIVADTRCCGWLDNTGTVTTSLVDTNSSNNSSSVRLRIR